MDQKTFSVIFLIFIYGAVLALFTADRSGITGFVVAESSTITITDEGFDPVEVTVYVGDTVTWQNEASYVAVLFSNNGKARFTSPILDGHETYSFTYENIGEFKYVDTNFGFKKGKIIVIEKPEEPEEPPEEPPECVSAADCADDDPCTVDTCSVLGCENVKTAGCALGDSCYALGKEILYNETTWTCIQDEWMSPVGPAKEQGSAITSIFAILLLLFLVLIFFFVKARPKHGRKRAKKR